MSSIEEVWQKMKRNITSCNPRPTTVPELRHAILEEWESLTPKVIANYTESVQERIHDLLTARGGHTKW